MCVFVLICGVLCGQNCNYEKEGISIFTKYFCDVIWYQLHIKQNPFSVGGKGARLNPD